MMAVTGKVLLDYREEFRRSFATVNPAFEEARTRLEDLYQMEEPHRVMTEREAEHLFYEYRRLRGWLYCLLPELEG